MRRPRAIPRVGSVLVLAAFAVAAAIAEPGYCQDRPLSGLGANALSTDPGWSLTGSLNTARCGHTATLLTSGKVLVVGGSNNGNCASFNLTTLDSAELYDPVTGSWSVTGSLKQPRANHTATLLPSGLVLVVGGVVATAGSFHTISTAELYDPVARNWSFTGNLTAPRAYHTATLLQNGKVLVTGGSGGGSGALASAELYDPSSGTWSRTGNLVTGRYWHTATQLQNGKVLIAGGLLDANPTTGPNKARAELYDPVSGIWTPTGDLNNDRSQHTATQMQDGKVLVASGDDPYDDYDEANGTAEIYDPGTATWSNTGNLRVIRDGHTATLLPSGKVLVTGGVYFSAKNDAELYDPVSGTWTPTGDFSTPRFFGHTATLLSNGKVLVAAGASEATSPTALDSAELYSDGAPPSTNVLLIEYFHAGFGHYFITSIPDEISKLDNGTFAGWARTGLQFNAYAAPRANSVPVCRFFSAAFAPKSSHFYTPFATECAITQADSMWMLESSDAFDIAVPTADGSCATGLTPVYRLYNNGQGGAPNHRYTTDLTVRAQMIAQGWVPEGLGPDAVEMCSPP
jgi:N-acetylneuraminic acid mutarotase